jgi:hypothetical protein
MLSFGVDVIILTAKKQVGSALSPPIIKGGGLQPGGPIGSAAHDFSLLWAPTITKRKSPASFCR